MEFKISNQDFTRFQETGKLTLSGETAYISSLQSDSACILINDEFPEQTIEARCVKMKEGREGIYGLMFERL